MALLLPLISVSQRTLVSSERCALGFNQHTITALPHVIFLISTRDRLIYWRIREGRTVGVRTDWKEEGASRRDRTWREGESEVRWEDRSRVINIVNSVWKDIFNPHFWTYGWVHANQVWYCPSLSLCSQSTCHMWTSGESGGQTPPGSLRELTDRGWYLWPCWVRGRPSGGSLCSWNTQLSVDWRQIYFDIV